jgi:hypothetical protein
MIKELIHYITHRSEKQAVLDSTRGDLDEKSLPIYERVLEELHLLEKQIKEKQIAKLH